MRKVIGLTVAIGMLAALGCGSSISVRHDFDRETNFAALKTYAWMQPPTTAVGNAKAAQTQNTLLDKRIKTAVDNELSAKGYKTGDDSTDFYVVYHVGVEDKVNVTDWGYSYAGPSRYYGWGGPSTVDVYQYQQGTLIIDVIQASDKHLVWRGAAQKALEENPTPEKIEKTINQAVAKVFANFPPK